MVFVLIKCIARVLAMPMLLFALSGILLALSGYFSPTPIDGQTGCGAQVLSPSRMLALCLGVFSFSLLSLFVGYDSIQLICVLMTLSALLFLTNANISGFDDLARHAKLTRPDCAQWGMALIFAMGAGMILALKTGRWLWRMDRFET